MVNKAALGVLGTIVLVSLGVGVLVGMQLGGPTGTQATENTGGDGGPTPIPTATTVAPTPDPTATPTPGGTASTSSTPTPTPQRTTVPARRFDGAAIEREVARLINERREEADLPALTTEGNEVEQIRRMAREHSVGMADRGVLAHELNGTTSADRYREHGLFDQCRFSNAEDSYLIDAEGTDLEAVGRTVAGRPYDGGASLNEDEEEVARAIVAEFFSESFYGERLTYANAVRIGVGVEVTRDGTVYATANVC